MSYRRSSRALLCLLAAVAPIAISATSSAQPATQPSQTLDRSQRVTFDRQCFTIDGKDTLIYSAAFHYFRCPKELWRDRFAKLKEAGFNTVETYAAWNWHEREMPSGLDDFSKIDMSELDAWLTMAQEEFGFYTIVRPGPYICAEWDGGGYPQWLTLKRPANYEGNWLRSDDPEYLKWCRHWYEAVAKATKPHLLTNKPVGAKGVILWQIENEYNYAGKPATEMLGQLLALGKMSKEFDIDVPLFTCVSHNDTLKNDPWLQGNVFDSDNIYPGFGLAGLPRRLSYLDRFQPNKPKMITELQGGWFATYGNKLSDQQGHTAAQITQLTMLMWELGFTATNYYMAFGGTNFGDWASANLMTSYDYNAPLREPGGVTERYFAVKGMGAFIAAEGDRLTRTEAVPIDVIEKTGNDVNVAVRQAKDGTRFVFVRTFDQGGPHKGTIRFVESNADEKKKPTVVRYNLGPFGSQVCVLPPNVDDDADGTWYPTPAAAPERPKTLPKPIEITSVKRKYDALPEMAAFRTYAAGQSVEDMGIFDRRTTVYRASVDLKPLTADGAKPVLNIALHDRDDANVIINGKRATQISSVDGSADYSVENAKTDGENDVVVIYENGGRPNGGAGMERRSGLSRTTFATASSVGQVVRGWKSRSVGNDAPEMFIAADFDDSAWSDARIDRDAAGQAEGSTFVYRASFDVAADAVGIERELKIGRIDDSGAVYLNGELLGKSVSWSEPFRADVTKRLKSGRNVLAVVVTNAQGGGGLSHGISIQPMRREGETISKIDWSFAPGTAGMLGGWSKKDVDDASWETVALTGRPLDADATAPLAWYRASFEVPAKDPKTWIPWKVRLNIAGNAFLYLNGEPLGRYWNAGPQRDFYLPENLLKQGKGEVNILTAAVRGIDKPEFRSATVMPYEDQAEVRGDRTTAASDAR